MFIERDKNGSYFEPDGKVRSFRDMNAFITYFNGLERRYPIITDKKAGDLLNDMSSPISEKGKGYRSRRHHNTGAGFELYTISDENNR